MTRDVNNLARAFESRQYEKVIERAGELIESGEANSGILRMRAMAFEAKQEFKLALRDYSEALELDPQDAPTRARLGTLLARLGKTEEAIAALRQAIESKSDFPEAYYNLGILLSKASRHGEAIRAFETALEYKPEYWQVLINLGVTHSILGNQEKSVQAIEKAIAIRPDFAESYRILSTLKSIDASGPIALHIGRTLQKPKLNDKDRQLLSFAMARICHDTGSFEKAFEHLKTGNSLHKIELGYAIEKDRSLFNSIMSVFKQGIEPIENEEISSSGKIPVFIVGMPRSGTSITEQILAGHSSLHGAGELDYLSNAVVAERGLAKYQGKEQLLRLRRAYLDQIRGLDFPERYFSDKMPLNFRWIGYIVKAFPEARIIHLKRDARATCWSIYQRYFAGQENGFAYDLDDIAQFYRLYRDLMDFWECLFPGKIYTLNYESLTENPETEVRNLVDHLGLQWDDNCLQFHSAGRAVNTASSLQVRKKIYTGSSEAWKVYSDKLGSLTNSLANY